MFVWLVYFHLFVSFLFIRSVFYVDLFSFSFVSFFFLCSFFPAYFLAFFENPTKWWTKNKKILKDIYSMIKFHEQLLQYRHRLNLLSHFPICSFRTWHIEQSLCSSICWCILSLQKYKSLLVRLLYRRSLPTLSRRYNGYNRISDRKHKMIKWFEVL